MNSILAESVTFAVTESFQNQRFITIRTYHPHGEREITGIVTSVDHSFDGIQFSHAHGVEYISMTDIMEALIGLD